MTALPMAPPPRPSLTSQLLTGYSNREVKFSQNSRGEVRNTKAKQPEEEDDVPGTAC